MKNNLFILFLMAFWQIGISAQKPVCQGVFVRDFQSPDGQVTELGKILAYDLETILTRQNCRVLLRSNHPEIAEKLNLLGKVLIRYDLPDTLREALFRAEAQVLISGKINTDNGGNANITVSILDLNVDLPPQFKTIHLSETELKDADYRQRKIGQMMLGGATDSPTGAASILTPTATKSDNDELALYQAFMKKPKRKNAAAYLSKFPSGQYLPNIASMMWGECLSSQNPGKCKDFLKLFPDDEHLEEALEIISEVVRVFNPEPDPEKTTQGSEQNDPEQETNEEDSLKSTPVNTGKSLNGKPPMATNTSDRKAHRTKPKDSTNKPKPPSVQKPSKVVSKPGVNTDKPARNAGKPSKGKDKPAKGGIKPPDKPGAAPKNTDKKTKNSSKPPDKPGTAPKSTDKPTKSSGKPPDKPGAAPKKSKGK